MNITITARHFKARPELKDFINEKMNKLKTYYDQIIEAEIILSFIKEEQIAEIKLHLDHKDHKLLVIKDQSDDMFKSVEQATDRLQVLLRRYKGRRNDFTHEKIVEHIEEPKSEKELAEEEF
jgi:putative sigma-54 modulation protein